MDKLSLVALLDEDREMIQAGIAQDRAPASVQTALEKAIDRVMYRYVERCEDAELRDNAQHILQAMKNTLPVMDTVGEAKTWKKQFEASDGKKLRMGPMATALLVGGIVLVVATVLATLISGRSGDPFLFIKGLLPTLLGCACLFWAGIKATRRPAEKEKRPEAVRTEFLVDAEKVFHCLRGAMLQADGQLERISEENALKNRLASEKTAVGSLANGELELFAELLESAYATPTDSGRESATAIRFFLHNAGIDAMDYESGREGWFEFLPASRPGTIRPALISEGRVLKKGLASARR